MVYDIQLIQDIQYNSFHNIQYHIPYMMSLQSIQYYMYNVHLEVNMFHVHYMVVNYYLIHHMVNNKIPNVHIHMYYNLYLDYNYIHKHIFHHLFYQNYIFHVHNMLFHQRQHLDIFHNYNQMILINIIIYLYYNHYNQN